MNKELIDRLSYRLSTDSGKETFTELSDEYSSGIVAVKRDLADVFAIQAMAQQIDESVNLDNHDALAESFDAREILNSHDQGDIAEVLVTVFSL